MINGFLVWFAMSRCLNISQAAHRILPIPGLIIITNVFLTIIMLGASSLSSMLSSCRGQHNHHHYLLKNTVLQCQPDEIFHRLCNRILLKHPVGPCAFHWAKLWRDDDVGDNDDVDDVYGGDGDSGYLVVICYLGLTL